MYSQSMSISVLFVALCILYALSVLDLGHMQAIEAYRTSIARSQIVLIILRESPDRLSNKSTIQSKLDDMSSRCRYPDHHSM